MYEVTFNEYTNPMQDTVSNEVIEIKKCEKDLLSVQDLTKMFEVSKPTIYKEIKAGKFGKPLKIGRAYKIPRAYIEHLLTSGNC